jgi:flavin reductase (DIM6/NTAB) family NADH-FMN oxidoreductase RutF
VTKERKEIRSNADEQDAIMELTPGEIPWKSMYKILIGSVVPRPIGWISTVDEEGCVNLAPFSFFNAVCPNPPTLLFCPNVRSADSNQKDTLHNVRATGEFVVNIVTEALAEAMNITSTEFPAQVNEFTAAGLTPVPSAVVRPPRVGESPIHFECRVMQIIEVGSSTGGGSIVVGEVVHLHIAEDVLTGTDKIDLLRLQPIGRLAGAAYCRVTDLFELPRPISQLKPVDPPL